MIVVTLLTLFCLFGTGPDGRGRQTVYAKPIPTTDPNNSTRNFDQETHLGTTLKSSIAAEIETEGIEGMDDGAQLPCSPDNGDPSCKLSHDSGLLKLMAQEIRRRISKDLKPQINTPMITSPNKIAKSVDSFIIECEKGHEDKAVCESYKNWLALKQAHENALRKLSSESSNLRSKRSKILAQHSNLRSKRQAEHEAVDMKTEGDDFKAECEKGNEDKANCDSYNEWLAWKEAHESALDKISAEQSNIRFKRQAEQEPGDMKSEVDDFKAECEKGNEDKANCDSYNEWLAWKEAHESALDKISAEQSNIRFKRQAEQEPGDMKSEVDDFKAECEKGNEDKATCDSYNEWLAWKEAHESALDKITAEQSNIRFKRQAEQEPGDMKSEVDDFKAECEKGNEDKATCDSYNEWLAWKEAHESAFDKISAEQSNIRFKRQAEQEPGDMKSEVDDFNIECEKGNEDKANCDSYNEWLAWKEAHESALDKISAEQSNIRFKRQAEQEPGDMKSEVDDFKAECEKGNEDKANCDSYNEWLAWKEAQESALDKISAEQSNIRFKRQAEQEPGDMKSEVDDFKAECEKGNEDKATCDSYNEWLAWKEAHESALDKISAEQSNIRFKRQAEQEPGDMKSEVDDFNIECEKGNEDKANCDSYNEWLAWKEAHESALDKISAEQSNIRFKRQAEQEPGDMKSEVDDFNIECEKGNEDKANCDSYNEWLAWKEAQESALDKISAEQSNIRFKRQAEQEPGDMKSEVDDFKAECEKGNEDKATCDSYNEWLAWKEAQESALDKISAEQSNIRFKRQAEQEPGDMKSEVDDFKAECEKGNEDKATCDSYNEWLAWKEAHESALDKISAEQSNIRFKRQAEQEDEMQELDNESNLELSEFKKACAEGTEDKDICESFHSLMKENKEEKHVLRRKRNAEALIETGKGEDDYESNLEISDFKKACEEGTEDKETCDSFYNLMKEKEEEKNIFRGKRIAEALIETGKGKDGYESNLEISDFKKACEEGTEDKDTCDSFYYLMKEKEEENILPRAKRDTVETDELASVKEKDLNTQNPGDMPPNIEEAEESSISKFTKDCEDGKEDQEACDSYFKWMEWKKTHDIFLKRNNEIESNDHLNNRVGKSAGKDKQTSDGHEKEDEDGDSERSEEGESELRKLDAKIRADLEEDDSYFAKISKGRSFEGPSSADRSSTLRKNSGEFKRRSSHSLDGFEAELEQANVITKVFDGVITGNNEPEMRPRVEAKKDMKVPKLHHSDAISKRQRRTVAEMLYKVLVKKNAAHKRMSPGRERKFENL